MREEYIINQKLLSENYNPDEIVISSTYKNRTILTAKSIFLGLYSANATKTITNSVFPPIKVSNFTVDEIPSFNELIPIRLDKNIIDKMMIPLDSCLEYLEHYERRLKSGALKKIFAKYSDVISTYAEYAKIPMSQAEDLILDVLDSAVSNKFHNYELPSIVNDQWLKRGMELYIETQTYFLYSPDYLARFSASELLKEILKILHFKMIGYLPPKAYIFAAHDTTIMNIFAALNIQLLEQPPFASVFIVELHWLFDAYYVKLIYNGSPVSLYKNDGKEKIIFEEFKNYVGMRTFFAVEEACSRIDKVTDFSQPHSESSEIKSLLYIDLFVMSFVIVGIYFLIKKIHK